MMKRTIINMMMVLGSAIAMVSCDTRENVFEDVEKRMIIIGEREDGRIDTLSASPDNVKVNIDLHIKERVETIGHSFLVEFEMIEYKLYAVLDGQKKSIDLERVYDNLKQSYFITYDPEFSAGVEGNTPAKLWLGDEYDDFKIGFSDLSWRVNSNNFEENCVSSNWFNNDGSARELYKTTIAIAYRMDGESHYDPIRKVYVNLTVWSDNSPVPVLEVKPISGQPMARTLSMKESYDIDGEVQKYEYCIDGNVMQYTHNDLHFDLVTGVWQSGKAAYGGTYITATELSEVNHVFQSKGTHNIYYRCMDDLGAWSKWELSTIEIE